MAGGALEQLDFGTRLVEDFGINSQHLIQVGFPAKSDCNMGSINSLSRSQNTRANLNLSWSRWAQCCSLLVGVEKTLCHLKPWVLIIVKRKELMLVSPLMPVARYHWWVYIVPPLMPFTRNSQLKIEVFLNTKFNCGRTIQQICKINRLWQQKARYTAGPEDWVGSVPA